MVSDGIPFAFLRNLCTGMVVGVGWLFCFNGAANSARAIGRKSELGGCSFGGGSFGTTEQSEWPVLRGSNAGFTIHKQLVLVMQLFFSNEVLRICCRTALVDLAKFSVKLAADMRACFWVVAMEIGRWLPKH